ncbi:GumC family protein [Calothrix sp. 336/3]|uniref:GumC family protein n=1 Tax=Calothrix sp. 336/3 TaxID=1337936 RepID=UPI0004E396F5|nr:polysaccharide biosynthesis tyrosine autokinase [Calothrix sp. 336/3]AKG20999.1 chain-length determining protein [Calothrix sp. 336/3]
MAKGISSLVAVLKRRGLPAAAAFVAVMGAAGAYLLLSPKLYEASARMMLDDKRVSVSDLGRDLTQVTSTTPGGPSPLADQAELVKSEKVLEKAIAATYPPGVKDSITPEKLRKKLKVKIVPATNILEFKYEARDAQLAAKLLNVIAQTMVEENTRTISSQATKVREFLEKKEVPAAQRNLTVAEANENRQKQASGIVSFDEQSKSVVTSLASLEDQERTALAQLQELRSRAASLEKITKTTSLDKAYSAVRTGQDEEVKKLRSKLTELEQQVIQAKLKFTEEHPTVTKLVQERDAVKAMYEQEVARVSPDGQSQTTNFASDDLTKDLTAQLITNQTESLAVQKKLRVIQAERANLQARLGKLPLQQQSVAALTRKREEAAESLKTLQRKLEEARIAEAQKVSNLSIIEFAKPGTSPSSPKIPVVLVVATVFGTVLATGIILLLEAMDNTLRSGWEAQDLLKLQLLGVLPRLPGSTLKLQSADTFLDDIGSVEPYRMLLKNIEFRNLEDLNSIVISSTISGEGKSVVASHLGAVSAMLSRKTLIIDADLRRPEQHRIFHLEHKPGVADVIAGNLSLMEAVQPSGTENLSVLTCGEMHNRPSQLLESPEMKALIAEATAKFDLVIIDTPPLCACADASTLSRYSDGMVVVTRPGFTLKEILQKAVVDLTHNGVKVLGIVVNGMTSDTDLYYRYPVTGYQPKLTPTNKSFTALSGGKNSK